VLLPAFVLFALATPSAAEAQRMAPARPAARPNETSARTNDELIRARALDREGARAYADGRYNDAIRYFEEAHRLGGPAFEIWNVAKCHLRLDQPEKAAERLERYLATPNLPPEDREEASKQLDALQRRPSTLTVSSSPSGAIVVVDGKTVEDAKTPLSVVVSPGAHTVTVVHDGYASQSRQVDAKFGRAIILDIPLESTSWADGEGGSVDRPISLRLVGAVTFPRFGAVGGSASPTGMLSATYRVARVGATSSFAVGALASLTGDSWNASTSTNGPVPACGAPVDATSATAASFFALGTFGGDIVPRLAVRALGGVGVATYGAEQLGGELFLPTCAASPGVRPAFLIGTQLDWKVTPLLRVTFLPLAVQLQSAFAGTRAEPRDAGGLWVRATLGVGLGFDL
jgi:hypothetical protein